MNKRLHHGLYVPVTVMKERTTGPQQAEAKNDQALRWAACAQKLPSGKQRNLQRIRGDIVTSVTSVPVHAWKWCNLQKPSVQSIIGTSELIYLRSHAIASALAVYLHPGPINGCRQFCVY